MQTTAGLQAYSRRCAERRARMTGKILLLVEEGLSDDQISQQTGLSVYAVARQRRAAGVLRPRGRPRGEKAERPHLPQREYPRPACFDLLGTVPDRAVAEQYGVSKQRVHQYRKKFGIPAYEPLQQRPEYFDLLGTMPDADIARKYGVSAMRVGGCRRRHDIPAYEPAWKRREYLDLLGKLPDTVIARQYGVSQISVCRQRNKRKIPVYTTVPVCATFFELLGKMPDAQLARQYEISAAAVWRQRHKYGIPAFQRSK